MKAYILKESDFDSLLAAIDRNPAHGYDGGLSQAMTDNELRIYNEAHRFYNYQIVKWIGKQQA